MGFFLSFINYPKILGFLIFGVNWVVVSYRVKNSIYTSNPTTSSSLQECFNWDRVITILSFPSLHTGQTSLSVSSNWRRKPRQNMAWCLAYVLACLCVKWLQWRRHIAIWAMAFVRRQLCRPSPHLLWKLSRKWLAYLLHTEWPETNQLPWVRSMHSWLLAAIN